MRLNLDNLSLPGSSPTPVESTTGRSGGGLAQGPGRGDSIQLSGASSAIHGANLERSARIEALSAAVAGGSYQIPSTQLAQSVIRHVGG